LLRSATSEPGLDAAVITQALARMLAEDFIAGVLSRSGSVALWSGQKPRLSAADHVVTGFFHFPDYSSSISALTNYKKGWTTGPCSKINGLGLDQGVTARDHT
jgi:hypothetical protein